MLPDGERAPVRRTTATLLERLTGHAEALGCSAELQTIGELLEKGNGAKRQTLVYEANHDLQELMGEIVGATA